MTYAEFLNRIDEFVEHVVEFTFKAKWNGKIMKSQRYVWDNKEFGQQKEDALIEVINVEDLGRKPALHITVAR